jgi:hypothetical protein
MRFYAIVTFHRAIIMYYLGCAPLIHSSGKLNLDGWPKKARSLLGKKSDLKLFDGEKYETRFVLLVCF